MTDFKEINVSLLFRSISPIAQLVATATRNCIGLWDLNTGRLVSKLADSPLGAIVTHAAINKAGT